MSSNKIIVLTIAYISIISIYALSSNFVEIYRYLPRFVLRILPIVVLLWPIVLFFFKPSKSPSSINKNIKNRKIDKKISRNIDNESKETGDISDIGLMSKVKRLKSLYKNGTLTKVEFEKAKNKLLK